MAKKNFCLTLKTARALIKQEFDLHGSFTVERAEGGVYIYKMQMGRFEVTVENDWFEHNGLIVMEVSSGMGETMRLYYEPDTLKENFEAEGKNRRDIREEWCEGCKWKERDG